MFAATLTLESPVDYQVFQQHAGHHGKVTLVGNFVEETASGYSVEVRINELGKEGRWIKAPGKFKTQSFTHTMEFPSGGWYRLEVRINNAGKLTVETVEHVGVGEVFVVAGQSNSANHGEEKQNTMTGRVATFDGKAWKLSQDPQPGASGGGGSFLPPLGDELVKRFNVPVGFVACGIGATSVREWLPQGTRFPQPPTITSRLEKLPAGDWQSKGEAYSMLVNRMKQMGKKGFRAVLWHQGESDAHQGDSTRTLPGSLYRQFMTQLIHESCKDIGWEAPWFVAQVSYHVPGDESWPDIREAQAALWKDGTAHEGPDSDSLKSEWRENGGKGVHFSGPGLREHARLWAEKLAPWLQKQKAGRQ